MNPSRYLPFAGRLFIGLPFVVNGLSKLVTDGVTIGVIVSPRPPTASSTVPKQRCNQSDHFASGVRLR